MGKGKLLITESFDFSSNAKCILERYYDVIVENIQNEEELLIHSEDVEVLFVRLKFKISKKTLDQFTKLKYILTATTGLDHIDVDYFESKGGQIISLKGAYQFLETIPSTAELTWGLMIALVRYIPQAFISVKEGAWDRDRFKGRNLRSLKLGVLGLGRVGKQIENFAKAFNMETGFFDTDPSKESERSVKFSVPEKLFEWADIVSVHIPLNEDNVGFLSRSLLSHLKSSAYLINTSRGAVVDELALRILIKQKQLAGYATDVLAEEIKGDISDNPLVDLAKKGYNVIITPHIAGCTYESMHITEDFVANLFVKNYLSFEK